MVGEEFLKGALKAAEHKEEEEKNTAPQPATPQQEDWDLGKWLKNKIVPAHQQAATQPSTPPPRKNFIVEGLGSYGSITKNIISIILMIGSVVGLFFFVIFHNWFLLSIAVVVAIIVFKTARSGSFVKFVSLLFILSLLAYTVFLVGSPAFGYVLHPENTPSPYIQGGVNTYLSRGASTYNSKFAKFIKNSQDYIQTQMKCASGNCPIGESDGPHVGMMLSEPQLMYSHKLVVGQPLDFSSTLEGVNLDIYPNVIVYPYCSVEGKKSYGNSSFNVSPSKILMVDLSNGQSVIMCNAVVIPSTYYHNEVAIGVVFNFTTESDLPLVIMNDNYRTSLEKAYGTKFLEPVFKINSSQVAHYNDGPINLGMKVSQSPLATRSNSESAYLIFALNNQWQSLNGAILKINRMNILTPNGIEIEHSDPFCPFVKVSSGNYSLESSFNLTQPVTDVLNFFCPIKVTKVKTNSPIWMPHISVVANYEYSMNNSNTFDVYRIKKKGEGLGYTTGSDDSGSGSSDLDLSGDCSSLTISDNLPPKVYIRQFESSPYSSDIKRGIADGVSKYKVDGFSDVQMASLLLGIMVAESGLGSNPKSDWDGDGIPNHIAGCTSCKNGNNNNVYLDIVDAAKAFKFDYEDLCSNYPPYDSQLDCALHAYNNGPNGKDNPKYRSIVKSSMAQWTNYLCKNSGGAVE